MNFDVRLLCTRLKMVTSVRIERRDSRVMHRLVMLVRLHSLQMVSSWHQGTPREEYSSGTGRGASITEPCRYITIINTIQAHDNVVISVDWHPIEPSKFATASWDGSIKIWD